MTDSAAKRKGANMGKIGMKAKRLEVSDVNVGPRYCDGSDRIALGCVLGDARYHVWLDPRTMDVGDTLYKNPPDGVDHKDPRYFNTRRFGVSSEFSHTLIGAMIEVYHSKGLLGQFEAALAREEEESRAKAEKERRAQQARDAAPALVAALEQVRTALTQGIPSAPQPALLNVVNQALRKAGAL